MKNTRPLQPDLVDFVRENPAANASDPPGIMQKVEYSSLLNGFGDRWLGDGKIDRLVYL